MRGMIEVGPPDHAGLRTRESAPRGAVEEGILETEKLRQYFVERYWAPEFAKRWQTRLEGVPGILSFYHSAYRELVDRAGGNPIDNRNTVYSEFPGVSSINESVPRYAGTPEALSYILEYYTPTGEIEDPVIAVHTTYDPGVPPHLPGHYGITTSIAGGDNLFVQHRVEADGHCNIDPPCTGRAFDQLRGWAAAAVRPEPLSLR